jgi:dihydroorotate dehydrogenase (fumarate)
MKQVKIPVAAKISSYFSGMTNMAVQLSGTGISGLVFFNRFYSPDIDIDKFEITTNHLFSSPAEMSQTLRWVAMLSDRVHCDIAASTGVHDGESVIKLLLAGAKAVQVASVLYQKGFGHIDVMLKDIEQWMNKHKFDNTSGFIGRMSIREVKNPAAFERVQFMKDFSSIE